MLNEDYRDMSRALVDEKVRFLLVGAYALAAHGYPRATMDIDIWVMPAPENADAVAISVQIEGITVHIPSLADLIRNKRASGRTKDMADAEALEELESSEPSVPGDA
jgi:hypothetical protein